MTMAATIERVQRPALVMAHNKTLAAQLCNEFRTFFPDNAVEYFVSYYDYYQPEAYVPSQGPLHREGLGDQPGDRPPAPRGDGRALRPARRDHRRLGVGDLRHGLAGDLRRQHAGPAPRATRSTATRCCASSSSIQYTRNDTALGPRHVPRARRVARGLPGLRARRRTGRRSSATRSSACSTSTRSPASSSHDDLEHVAIWPATHYNVKEGTIESAVARDRARAQRALRRARGRGQAAGEPPPAPAHAVRHGDAARDGLLQRHRELLAHPRRPHARRPAVLPASTTSPRTSSASSTSPTRPCRRSAACTRATARASRRSSTTASGCPARWTTARRPSTSSCRSRRRCVFVSATPGDFERSHSSRDRRADRAPDGHRRPGRRGARDAQPDRRPDERDPRARRPRRARARHDAHEEDERGPDRLPARDGLQGPLPALGGRHARAHPDHPRPAAGGVRRARRREPAARGARPARGLARRRSSTPTRRASCAARRRSSRRSAARRATSTAPC